jgi:hypothetical protein
MDYLEASGLVSDRGGTERVAVVCGRRAGRGEPAADERREARVPARAPVS